MKINIRDGSIFSNIKCDLRIIYFVIFYNFSKNYSVNLAFRNSRDFSKDLKLEYISKQHIGKIYNLVSQKIMKSTHNFWNNNYMAMEPGIDGKSRIEIDESKVFTFNNMLRWMFGIVDRNNYDVRIFFVNDTQTKETLLPLIIKNVYTYPLVINNNVDSDFEHPATRIYSDCFNTYQKEDFNSKGYILYKVNHSV